MVGGEITTMGIKEIIIIKKNQRSTQAKSCIATAWHWRLQQQQSFEREVLPCGTAQRALVAT